MSVENLHGKSHDHWTTPDFILKAFWSWYDPCPIKGDRGLVDQWADRTFVNPPYSDPLPWVKKAIRESKKGKTIVMLLKVDPSTEWWLKLVEAGAHFAWFIHDGTNSGRLAFSGSDKAAFPSVLVFLPATPTEKPTEGE